MDEKRCTKCGTLKPLSGFSRQASRLSGLRPTCKDCDRLRQAIYNARMRARNTVASPVDGMKRCRKCGAMKPLTEFYRDRISLDGRDWDCKECVLQEASWRERTLRGKFGITQEQYDWMLQVQGGVCAICGQVEMTPTNSGHPRRLAVDHDYKTKALRGLLCRSCNIGIGGFGDDIAKLESAIRYLEAVRKR